jgi:hypothetical protein
MRDQSSHFTADPWPRFQRHIRDAVNKRAFRLRVRLAIEAMLPRQSPFQRFVFPGNIRMSPPVVAKGNWTNPLR